MKSYLILSLLFIFCLNAMAESNKSNNNSKIISKNIFPEATYWGNIFSKKVIKTENFTVDPNTVDTATFMVRLLNADGNPHEIKSCHGHFFQALACYFNNLKEQIYVQIARVMWAEIELNGNKIVSESQFNKSVFKLEKQIKLKPNQNIIKISYKGFLGSFFKVSVYQIINNQDITPPVIAASVKDHQITNQVAANVTIEDQSNVSSSVYINNNLILNSNLKTFSFNLVNGVNNIEIKSTDQFNNVAQSLKVANVVLDQISPVVKINFANNQLTNKVILNIPISVSDDNEVLSKLSVNGEELLRTSAKEFSFAAELKLEGENQIQLTATDAAGNSTTSEVLKIKRDTVAPVLTMTSPIEGQILQDVQFFVSGSSNEELSELKINQLNVATGQDKKSFNVSYLSQYDGKQSINFSAMDLAGNEITKTINFEIHAPLLVKELVSVTPTTNEKVLIHGAMQSSRAGLSIKASEGFFSFNSDQSTVNPDGSFNLVLKPFQTATITVEDPRVNQKASMTVSYSAKTKLSGIIRDTNDMAIPNVTINISGTNYSTVSNAQGAFSFELNISGDQKLLIDGSTVPQSFTGPNRSFPKTSLSLNLGYGQSNVLERPIYLTPLILDGTQITVSANNPTNISSSHAPGVNLNIPANSTFFPTGSMQGNINIMTISADKTTIPVPPNAVPKEVISLEPSGLKFNKRVELTLPNSYDLPANTDVVIFSMDSSKGKWEIDGMAKVSSDGDTIKTLPNEGISHFSIVYAVPLMPSLVGLMDSQLNAVDSSKDSYQSQISLPSFKVADSSVSPQLIYKSNWAQPTAFVSNYIEIPKRKISYQKSGTSTTSGYSSIFVGETCGLFKCWDRYADFYTSTINNFSVQETAIYVPTGIKSQFFISSIKSSDLSLGNISLDNAKTSSEIFDDGERIGLLSKINNFQKLDQFQSIPMRNQISYSVELQDPVTKNYLESGLYPTLARYQIQLKNITLKTVQKRSDFYGYFDSSYVPVEYKNVYKNLLNESKTTLESQVLNDFLPKDVSSNVIVQNQVNSDAGRGWRISGYQKILNPSSRSIVIEEADGNVNTYEMKNLISTLYYSNNESIKIDQALDFSNWPIIRINYKSSNNKNYLGELDLSQKNPNIKGLYEISTASGYIANQGYYTCPDSLYTGTFSTYRQSYQYQPNLTGVLKLSENKWIAVDNRAHRIIEISDNAKDVIGNKTDIETTVRQTISSGIINDSANNVNQICQNIFGSNCGPLETVQSGLSCTAAIIPVCTVGTFCKPVQTPKFIEGIGESYVSGYSGDGQQGLVNSNPDWIALNNPQGLAVDSNNIIYVADTGNNRVRKIDPLSGTISTFAGNGENYDYISSNGNALSTSIYHPKQLKMDKQNNLYISTESGYILKVNTQGQISKVAGTPLDMGGVYATESYAPIFTFNNPTGMALDEKNQFLYVADTGYHRVVRIDLINNQANVVAGNSTCNLSSNDDGKAATNASLCSPTYLHLDDDNNLIVLESGRRSIRKINFSELNNAGVQSYLANNRDNSILIKNADSSWTRKMRDGTVIEFNQKGLQQSLIDRASRKTEYEYNSDLNLTKIKFFTGQEISYLYSGGYLSKIIDASNRHTNFSYSDNKLVQVNFPDGSSKKFDYSDKGLMVSEVNQLGNKLKIEYSENNRVNKIKMPDNTEIKWNDAISKSLSMENDDSNLLAKGIGFDENQNNSNLIDANGGSSYIVNDINGYSILNQDAMGNKTLIHRDFNGRTLGVTKPKGSSIHYSYDDQTDDIIQSEEFYELEYPTILKNYKYNDFGQLLEEVSSVNGNNKQTTTKEYDTKGNLIKIVNTDGSKQEMSYYDNGLLKSKTTYESANGAALTTTLYRNNFGQVNKIITPENTEVKFNLDLSGNVIEKIEPVSAGQTAITKYEYDSFNHLKKVVLPNNEITLYEYDLMGNLVSITDPKNRVTKFEYNVKNLLIKKTDAFGSVYEYNYDSNGNLNYMKDPNGQVKTMEYNLINQITKANLPDDVIEYAYDYGGEFVSSVQNKNSSVGYFRRLNGQIINEFTIGLGNYSNHPEMNIDYQYNLRNLLSKQTTSIGNIEYSYDELNRLKNMTAFNKNFNFSYDDVSRLKTLTRGNIKTEFSYQNSLLKKIAHTNLNSSGSISENEYSYNQRNFPIQKRTLASVSNYDYDGNGQLKSAVNNSISGVTATSETYSYDQLGNRILDHKTNYDYDITGQRLVQDGFYSYQYDNNGNLINKISKDSLKLSYHYEYSSSNQMILAKVMTGSVGNFIVQKEISYGYDVLGRRMQKQVKDYINNISYIRKYSYNGDNVIAEYDGNNALLARYTHSPLSPDDLLAADFSSQAVSAGLSNQTGTVYYLKDHLNSVTDIASETGSVLQKYEYSSFGEILKIKNSSDVEVNFDTATFKTSFTYTSREYEPELNLYYYRARYYDPTNGRFLQQDPDPGKLRNPSSVVNKFIYVSNNPLIYTDSTGRDFMHDLGVAVVIVAGFASGAWVAGLAAGYLGFAAGTAAAMITGTLVGAAVGGAVGAIAFPAFGLGTSEQGFMIGAMAGGLGGFAKGAGLLGDYSVSQYKGGRLISGIESKVNASIDSLASRGSTGANFVLPRGTEFAATLGALEPYAIGIGGGLYLDNMVYQCSKGNCNIPLQSKNWDF